MTPPVRKGEAIVLEQQHPMANSVVELLGEGRKAYGHMEKLAQQMYKDVTGEELPKNVMFTQPDGSLWCLQVHIEVRQVRRAGPEEEGND